MTPQTAGYEVPQAVTWAITATNTGVATGGVRLKNGTYIDAEGVLHVDADETAENVSITATSTYIDPTVAIEDQTYQTKTLIVGIGKVYSAG